ncbi:MAG: hypothetical protein KDD70_08895, partial [Bdellovibrionales bacterium]|nr:hypothetical protein [Bdellovibrionales bacterium]
GWPEKRADDSLQETFSDQKLNSYLSSLGFPNLELLLAHELWYVPAQLVSSETQSLQKPYLSILGASDLFAGKEVDLRTLLHGKGKWYYQLLGSKRALISAVPVRQLRERLPQLIERGCGGTRVSLKEPEWRTERTLCRDAVVAAMVFGATEVPQQMKSDIAWVREFLSGVFSDGPIVPVEELSRYALFDSVFVRLDPQTLIARLGPCFSVSTAKAQECQQQLVRTLSLTGHSKQARAVLELLPAGERPAELVEYVNLNERLIESR